MKVDNLADFPQVVAEGFRGDPIADVCVVNEDREHEFPAFRRYHVTRQSLARHQRRSIHRVVRVQRPRLCLHLVTNGTVLRNIFRQSAIDSQPGERVPIRREIGPFRHVSQQLNGGLWSDKITTRPARCSTERNRIHINTRLFEKGMLPLESGG